MAAPTKTDINCSVTFDHGTNTGISGKLRRYTEDTDTAGTAVYFTVEHSTSSLPTNPILLTPGNNVQKA